MNSESVRIRAILKSIYHGIMPWWVYERQRHYACSWLTHLYINLRYAFRWLTWRETESDFEFERRINKIKQHE